MFTGAADDDPSGIATYSQAGAHFGYCLRRTVFLTTPFIIAIQLVSARIGRVTGKGIVANTKEFYPRPLVVGLVALLVVANTINIATDIAAMGEALYLVRARAKRGALGSRPRSRIELCGCPPNGTRCQVDGYQSHGGVAGIVNTIRYSVRRPIVIGRSSVWLEPIDHRSGPGLPEGNVVGEPEAKRLGALPSAIGSITRLAYAQAKAASADVELLLKKAGLTREQVENPGARLKVRDQINFLNLAAEALHDDLLGFHLAQSCDLREFGLLYYVTASADTLGEALQRAARCSPIANEGVSLKYFDGKDVGFTFAYVGVSRHLDRHQIEFFVTILVRMCRQLTGRRLVPTRVRLIHRRDSIRPEFLEFFGSAVELGAAADEVAFAAAVKHLPIISADPYLNKLLITYCEEALSHRRANLGSFRSIVENAIVPLLPHGKAQVAEVARRLGVSRRTFARRLSLEGVTFSEVLENLRSDLAKRYLSDESLSISQIAWLLGYQEASSFTHAFKRWTGKTPREVRSRTAF